MKKYVILNCIENNMGDFSKRKDYKGELHGDTMIIVGNSGDSHIFENRDWVKYFVMSPSNFK